MRVLLIWIVTALYVGQCLVFLWQRNPWLALVFAGYALANIGMIYGAAY